MFLVVVCRFFAFGHHHRLALCACIPGGIGGEAVIKLAWYRIKPEISTPY